MVERGEELGFAFEAGDAIGIDSEEFRQDLQRDIAIQLRVARAIDLAHPAGTQWGKDLVRAESCAGLERHSSLRADYSWPQILKSSNLEVLRFKDFTRPHRVLAVNPAHRLFQRPPNSKHAPDRIHALTLGKDSAVVKLPNTAHVAGKREPDSAADLDHRVRGRSAELAEPGKTRRRADVGRSKQCVQERHDIRIGGSAPPDS